MRAYTQRLSNNSEISLQTTKPQLALEQICAAVTAKMARDAVLMDESYGTNSGLRRAITGLGLGYPAAIISTVRVRPMREGHAKPNRVSVEALARSLPKHAWRTITWREGSNAKLRSVSANNGLSHFIDVM
jgi:SRSO17 transposase